MNSGSRQSLIERITIELWQAPRHGEGPDVDQRLNPMRPQGHYKIVESAGRMSDGVENGQRGLDAENGLCDSTERGCDYLVLLGKRRAQIKQHSSFFYTGNDGGIGAAQPRGQFVGTEISAGQSQQARGQHG